MGCLLDEGCSIGFWVVVLCISGSNVFFLRQCETEKLIINHCCWKMEGGELDEITSVELGARIHKGYSSGRRE